jgi:hypothetical protein
MCRGDGAFRRGSREKRRERLRVARLFFPALYGAGLNCAAPRRRSRDTEGTYGAEDLCGDRVAVWMVKTNADPSLARDDRSSTAILATCYGDTKGAANGTVPFDCLRF